MQDGYSYTCSSGTFTTSGQNIWQRNAYTYEGVSFDSCGGHPDQSGSYHNHVDPSCLYTKSSTTHSPIIGWMMDGYPIYGPYGYTSNTNLTIKQMISGYQLRTDLATNSVRNTLMSCASGTCVTTNAQYCGPTVSTTYPLGNLIQDWVWKSGSDLGIFFIFK